MTTSKQSRFRNLGKTPVSEVVTERNTDEIEAMWDLIEVSRSQAKSKQMKALSGLRPTSSKFTRALEHLVPESLMEDSTSGHRGGDSRAAAAHGYEKIYKGLPLNPLTANSLSGPDDMLSTLRKYDKYELKTGKKTPAVPKNLVSQVGKGKWGKNKQTKPKEKRTDCGKEKADLLDLSSFRRGKPDSIYIPPSVEEALNRYQVSLLVEASDKGRMPVQRNIFTKAYLKMPANYSSKNVSPPVEVVNSCRPKLEGVKENRMKEKSRRKVVWSSDTESENELVGKRTISTQATIERRAITERKTVDNTVNNFSIKTDSDQSFSPSLSLTTQNEKVAINKTVESLPPPQPKSLNESVTNAREKSPPKSVSVSYLRKSAEAPYVSLPLEDRYDPKQVRPLRSIVSRTLQFTKPKLNKFLGETDLRADEIDAIRNNILNKMSRLPHVYKLDAPMNLQMEGMEVPVRKKDLIKTGMDFEPLYDKSRRNRLL